MQTTRREANRLEERARLIWEGARIARYSSRSWQLYALDPDNALTYRDIFLGRPEELRDFINAKIRNA